ncbi:putative multidrug resistance-associated protein 1-like [Triplophysa rosa]|uniref:Multidrug resistance-associated protein 1-like n=1 Tax=Triplophysa rosa TaxID=992332 RepID=A0A9W7WC40_TRIRA|nr:putative multidrug resistance-associated protein 1-like [Triplophysa rosa]
MRIIFEEKTYSVCCQAHKRESYQVPVMGHKGDLCKLYNEDSLQTLCSVFEHQFNKQHKYREGSDLEDSGREALLVSSKTTSGYSLLYAIWKTFRPAFVKVVLLRLTTDILSILGPLTLRWIVLFCESQPVFDWAGYMYSLVVLGAICCCAVSRQQFERHGGVTTANIQTVMAGVLYRKVTLSLSHSSQRQPKLPDTVPLPSREAECVGGLVVSLACFWSSPLRVALYLGLLWRELGPGALVGVVVMLILIPVNSAVQRKVKLLQTTQQVIRENTEELVKEMLHKFQALKLLAWEPWFHQRVTKSRARELEMLRVLGYPTAFSMLDSICMPFLVLFFSLGVFVLGDDGNVLTASQILTSLIVFSLLRPAVMDLCWLFSGLEQAYQSLCHLEKLFLTKDPDDKHCDFNDGKDHGLFQKSNGEAHRLYLEAFGWHWAAESTLIYLSVCAVCLAQYVVLSVWTREAKEVQGLEEWRELRDSRLAAYALLGLVQVLLVCCAAYCQSCGSLRASDALHSELLSDVLHLPVRVDQTIDLKKLLQTFTRDMQVIDEELPKHLHGWLKSLLEILSAVAVIAFIMPVFSLAVCPLVMLFLGVQCQFSAHMKTRRMESNPVVSVSSQECVEDPLSGPKEVCVKHHLQALNQNLLVKYNRIITESWFALRLDAIAGILLFLVSLILLETQLDSGIVALALICAQNITAPLHRYTQAFSDVNTGMLSMQRLCEIARIEKEAAWIVSHRPPFDWPQRGEVVFRNYDCDALYNLSPALRGLNLTILKGERIGVMSRQKADTEGFLNCLYRVAEASNGAVLIDSVNIARVGLHNLRSHLQIISQVPVLFSGPLRANLDPFARHTDTQVWLALELCHLKEQVRQLPAQLLHPVQRTSIALSLGQRRLLCLARARLARVKILLVEEALPSVDLETEQLVQRLVHTGFKDCTVLWLSQNPATVMHTDKVLVLNKGQAVTFDATSTVLEQGSLFSQ